jgi:hypothetical protein
MQRMVIEDETTRVWLDNGIIHFEYKPGAIVNLEVQKKNIQDRTTLAQGIARPVLADGRQAKYWTQDAKQYSLSKEGLLLAAAFAILSDSNVTRVSLNWTLKFLKPKVPMRVFTDKAKALEWLEQFK